MWFTKKKDRERLAEKEKPFAEKEKPSIFGRGIPTVPRLNVHDGAWIYMVQYCDRKLKELREMNDSLDLDATQTAVIRGRIRALKDVLEIPNEDRPVKPLGIVERVVEDPY